MRRILPACVPEQGEVPGLPEDDFIDRLESRGPEDGIAGGTSDRLTVGHEERKVLLDDLYSNLLKRVSGTHVSSEPLFTRS